MKHRSYQDIYESRGDRYHDAMARYPEARAAEFRAMVDVLNLPGNKGMILDIPSGGGYLRSYLPPEAHLISVDPARTFLEAGPHTGEDGIVCAPHNHLPFDTNFADAIVSLAGLHHLGEIAPVFDEWHRVLKPGGVLAIGDAQQDSPTAKFLDEIVNRHNAMGHHGNYLDASIRHPMKDAGFTIDSMGPRAYTWDFAHQAGMLDFCRTLFSMDQNPTNHELLDDIQATVGYQENTSGCHLNWSLFFVRATKAT